MLYNLRRISEICKEHVENNFRPLPSRYVMDFEQICTRISILFNDTLTMMDSREIETVHMLRRQCDEIKDKISITYHRLYDQLRDGDPAVVTVLYVYLNTLQETREMVSSLRKYLRAFAKMIDNDFSGRGDRIAITARNISNTES